jgi:hypothetical protein
MRLGGGSRGAIAIRPKRARVTLAAGLAAASLALAASPAPAATSNDATAAAQRTIALSNFIVNRDVLALRGGQTTNVVALCPGKTRFFTSGFRPFGVQRGAPRVNFIVTAIIPRPNGVTYRFFNPHPAGTFPVNIRVSAMCLTLGTVSVGGTASERAAESSGALATDAAKKKGKGKPKLKARVTKKTVKVGKKKKAKKKQKGRSATAEAAVNIRLTNIRLNCDGDNEMPAQFGFEHGANTMFNGATPFRSKDGVGLRGQFETDGKDTVKFHLLCLRAQGPVNISSRIGDGGGPGGPSMVNHYFEQGPSSSMSLGDAYRQVNYTNTGIINGEFLTGIGLPPTPVGEGTWSGDNAFRGNGFNPMTGQGFNLFNFISSAFAAADNPAVFSLLRLRGINGDGLRQVDDPLVDLLLATACSDTADNDGDTKKDALDPGCLSEADVDESDLTGTGPCPAAGSIPFSGELTNAGSRMERHQLKINGGVVVDRPLGAADFASGSTLIMGVVCSGGTVVDVGVSWTVTGTTVKYDFSVFHVSGPGGDGFEKTIAAETSDVS